ncbi:MAG: HNH endonuclease [Eubacteriales bacterium]|nr:HNH endonuclease [Eubacteriales bacterium]
MFNPSLSIGQILTEKEVHRTFECQTTFGIRLNKKNNAIVIVTDATPKNPYADRWLDDVLLYTGTDAGKDSIGNQTLTGVGNNNGALYNVWFAEESNRPTLFLFVKYAANECTYKGRVELNQKPYQELRKSSPNQRVWIFPLKLEPTDATQLDERFCIEEEKSTAVGEDFLLKRIKEKEKNSNLIRGALKRQATIDYFDRDPNVSAYVKMRADGICDLCQKIAPFKTVYSRPYLESHHIIWLSKGGSDTIDNTVALCPNCHRKMHMLGLIEDEKKLHERILNDVDCIPKQSVNDI